jgi:hypothetical protein
MAKSSAVHTPRNVDLPSHVIRPKNVSSKKTDGRRKRCLCLSCWLLGLVLLCAGVVVIAHFLLPAVSQAQDSNVLSDDRPTVEHISNTFCIDRSRDIYSLEQKLQLSETIVVGTVDQGLIQVSRVLKESSNSDRKIDKSVRLDLGQEVCHLETRSRQMFFLSGPGSGSNASEKLVAGPETFRARFRSMLTTPKLVQIVVRILSNDFSDNSSGETRQHLRMEQASDPSARQQPKGTYPDFGDPVLTYGQTLNPRGKVVPPGVNFVH